MLNIYGGLLLVVPGPMLVLKASIFKDDSVMCLYFFPSVSDVLIFSALDPLIYKHAMWVAVCACVVLLTAKPWLNPIYCAPM